MNRPPILPSRPRRVFAVLATAIAGYTLLQSLLNPVLATLQRELHATQLATTCVITAYLLSASVSTPVLGRLGDLYGKRRMFLVAAAALVAGSLVDATADSIGVVVAGRVVQGVGGGLLSLASLIGVGSGAGVVLAGPVVTALGYHGLFWIPLIIVGAAGLAAVRESPVRAPGRFNPGAAVLMAGWLAALLLALSQGPQWGWGSGPTLLLALLAAAGALAGLLVPGHRTDPVPETTTLGAQP